MWTPVREGITLYTYDGRVAQCHGCKLLILCRDIHPCSADYRERAAQALFLQCTSALGERSGGLMVKITPGFWISCPDATCQIRQADEQDLFAIMTIMVVVYLYHSSTCCQFHHGYHSAEAVPRSAHCNAFHKIAYGTKNNAATTACILKATVLAQTPPKPTPQPSPGYRRFT